jgi:hypothetical protein
MFGAKADGVADDTITWNKASMFASSNTGLMIIGDGAYALKNGYVYENTRVELSKNAVITNYDTADLTSDNITIHLDGDNISWSGGTVQGVTSTTYGTVPTPYKNFNVQKSTGDEIPKNILVENLSITGGNQGLWTVATDEMTLSNITVREPYQWGIACAAPAHRNLIIKNCRVFNSGINEGLKIASLYQQIGYSASNILIDGLHIEGCGKLNPDTGTWQNGMDFFISAAQRMIITNFNVVDCGGGGIELKRNYAPDITVDEYSDVTISNGNIQLVDDSASCITINMTLPDPLTPDTGKRIHIHGVKMVWAGVASPTSANGISTHAWTDVTIEDCKFNGDFTRYINPSGYGSSDTTVRRMSIIGCVGNGGQYGIYHSSNTIEELFVSGNKFNCKYSCLAFGSSTTGDGLSVKSNYFRSSLGGAGDPVIYIAGNVINCDISDNTLESTDISGGAGFPVRFDSGFGEIYNNKLISVASEAIRSSGGTWKVFNNEIRIPDTERGASYAAGTLSYTMNNRGLASAIPSTMYGYLGDTYTNSSPTAGTYSKWVAVASGSPATWKGLGIIQV